MIFDRLVPLVAAQFGIKAEDITMETSLTEDLDADSSFPDFLQGINDNQSGVRMLRYKAIKLFVKPCAELLGASCEVEGICTLYSEHTGQTLLQASVIILQGKV